jgi:hypothetical protein
MRNKTAQPKQDKGEKCGNEVIKNGQENGKKEGENMEIIQKEVSHYFGACCRRLQNGTSIPRSWSRRTGRRQRGKRKR